MFQARVPQAFTLVGYDRGGVETGCRAVALPERAEIHVVAELEAEVEQPLAGRAHAIVRLRTAMAGALRLPGVGPGRHPDWPQLAKPLSRRRQGRTHQLAPPG